MLNNNIQHNTKNIILLHYKMLKAITKMRFQQNIIPLIKNMNNMVIYFKENGKSQHFF